MDVKILGSGCKNCQLLEHRAREAATELGIDPTFTKVTDVADIAAYGVLRTPALVIDDELVASGSVPTVTALQELLAEHR